MSRATITIQVEGNHIGIADNTSHTDNTKRSFNEKVVHFCEERAWCHNVSNIFNFRKHESRILVDIEYNMN